MLYKLHELPPESCPFCGAGIMLRGSGTTFLCESWKHRNGGMDQSRECLNRQCDQLLDRIKRLEELGSELRDCASRIGTVASGEASVIRRSQKAIEEWDNKTK